MENRKLELMYGKQFPGLDVFGKEPTKTDGEKWHAWVRARMQDQKLTRDARNLHNARHRHFKAGRQWISSRDGRTWREPNKNKNEMRVTVNMIGPALDYRLGVVREQRPGFKWEPLGADLSAREQAQAQQQVVDYYFYAQKAWIIGMDAAQAAQTDGVAFLHVYIDPDAGPEKERVDLIPPDDTRYSALKALGYRVRDNGLIELPLSEGGDPLNPGAEASKKAQGDIMTRVVYAHQITADPEAKTINGPYDAARWLIISIPRDLESARLETGDPELEPDAETEAESGQYPFAEGVGYHQRGLPAFPDTHLQHGKIVYEHLVFFRKSKVFPKGAWLRIIGKRVMQAVKELPGGVIPLARITDGSSDPQLFPRPVMSDWLGEQVAINALASLLVQHERVWGPGRMIVQKDTVLTETWTNIVGSLVQYSGMKPDVLTQPQGRNSAWQLLEFFTKKLEDKTGWNDIARGQVGGSGSFQDVSGRAVLGARELFERALGPMVRAVAQGMSEWAELVVIYAQYLFDEPRIIPLVGGRTDLARKISKDMLGTRPMVYCDPETLIPLPRALRQQMLWDMYTQGVITLAEYKSRAPFAIVQDVYSGEAQQWNRAQRINEILSERYEILDEMAEQDPLMPYLPENGAPILWADDPAVHQSALLEIILDDRKPWKLRRIALERYVIYQELAVAQLGGGEIDPSTGMPVPAAVPLEVIGAPASLPKMGQPVTMERAPAGDALVPGTPPTALAAPESSATGLPMASLQEAAPLGTFGTVEEALAGGESLPQ